MKTMDEFSKVSAFGQAQEILDKQKEKQAEQLQIPGLVDAVGVASGGTDRIAALQRDPELERIYDLANSRPRDLEEALERLGDIADGLYRFLY